MMFSPSDSQDTTVLVRPRNASIVTAWRGVGKLRTRLTVQDWCFLILSIINILTAMGLTIYRLRIVITQESTESPDFTFSILILVNAMFCLYYVLDGLFREREFELYVLVISIFTVLLYCLIEYIFHDDGRNTIKLIRLILIAALAPPNIGLAIAVARQFGYLEFYIVGTSTRLQGMYREAARFLSAIKFDVQISVCLLILTMHSWDNINRQEICVLAIGIPVIITWAVIGWISLAKENIILVGVFTMLGIIEPAYVIYKIWQMTDSLRGKAAISDDDAVIANLTLVACGLALGVRIIVYFELSRVTKNFGYGLRSRVFTDESIHMGGNESHHAEDPPHTTSTEQERY